MNATETATRFGDIYAGTLFELADESHQVDPIMDDLAVIEKVLQENPEFAAMLGSPWFDLEYKSGLLAKLFTGRATDLTLDFLMVATLHDRLMYLPQMVVKYRQLWEARQGLQTVRATVSAQESAAKVQQLSEEIAAILRSKVKLEVLVDPSIMGGMVLRYEDKVIDNSVRTRLHCAMATIMKRQNMQG
jgi:F-type H+-transporting ATPase subunit delta